MLKDIPKGKRSVENPRKRWLDGVKNNLKEVDVRGWRKTAKHRNAWELILKNQWIIEPLDRVGLLLLLLLLLTWKASWNWRRNKFLPSFTLQSVSGSLSHCPALFYPLSHLSSLKHLIKLRLYLTDGTVWITELPSILIETNPLHTIKIHFNIIPLRMPWSLKCSLLFAFTDIPVRATYHIPAPLPSLYNPNIKHSVIYTTNY